MYDFVEGIVISNPLHIIEANINIMQYFLRFVIREGLEIIFAKFISK